MTQVLNQALENLAVLTKEKHNYSISSVGFPNVAFLAVVVVVHQARVNGALIVPFLLRLANRIPRCERIAACERHR